MGIVRANQTNYAEHTTSLKQTRYQVGTGDAPWVSVDPHAQITFFYLWVKKSDLSGLHAKCCGFKARIGCMILMR